MIVPASISLFRYKNTNFTSGKYRLVATSISSCETQSRAELYLLELRKYLPTLDVYGSCDQPGAVKSALLRGQLPDLRHPITMDTIKTYKFYLAFENNICPHTLSRLMWESLVIGTVPVVLGGANYTNILPPGSFLDVKDFASPGGTCREIGKIE